MRHLCWTKHLQMLKIPPTLPTLQLKQHYAAYSPLLLKLVLLALLQVDKTAAGTEDHP